MKLSARLGVGVLTFGLLLAASWPVLRTWRQIDGQRHAERLEKDRTSTGQASVTHPDDPASWPAFRGVGRDGVVQGPALASSWGAEGPPELFRHPIGGGYAGFVVGQGRAFTIEQRGDDEVAAAYDLHTGRELWSHAWPGRFSEAMGGDGPRATPTLADGAVFVYGANGDLFAFEAATGEVRWKHQPLEELEIGNLMWGMSGSPLRVENQLIVPTSGQDGPAFISYDLQSGEELWVSETFVQGYSSPALVELAGRSQVLHQAGDQVVGLDPESGDTLWSHSWSSGQSVIAAQPIVVGNDRVWISSGSNTGSAMIRVDADGTTEEVWRSPKMSGGFAGGVLYEGVLYGLDRGVLTAQSAESGQILWTAGRFGNGQVLLTDDVLVVTSDKGEVALVRASAEGPVELARMQALEGLTWNVPALADGRLLVRNTREMAAFDLAVR